MSVYNDFTVYPQIVTAWRGTGST